MVSRPSCEGLEKIMENGKAQAVYEFVKSAKQAGCTPEDTLPVLDTSEQIPEQYKDLYLDTVSGKYQREAAKGKDVYGK